MLYPRMCGRMRNSYMTTGIPVVRGQAISVSLHASNLKLDRSLMILILMSASVGGSFDNLEKLVIAMHKVPINCAVCGWNSKQLGICLLLLELVNKPANKLWRLTSNCSNNDNSSRIPRGNSASRVTMNSWSFRRYVVLTFLQSALTHLCTETKSCSHS